MHVTFTREKSATTPWVKHYLEDELDASSMTLPTILITHHPLCAEVWNFWRRVVFCLLFFVCNHLFFAICSSMHLDLMIARNILRGVKHFQKSSLEGWKSFCRKVYLRTRGGTHLHLTCHFTKSECSRRAWTTLNNGIPPPIESDSCFLNRIEELRLQWDWLKLREIITTRSKSWTGILFLYSRIEWQIVQEFLLRKFHDSLVGKPNFSLLEKGVKCDRVKMTNSVEEIMAIHIQHLFVYLLIMMMASLKVPFHFILCSSAEIVFLLSLTNVNNILYFTKCKGFPSAARRSSSVLQSFRENPFSRLV